MSTAVAKRLRARLKEAAKRPSVTLEEYRASKRSYDRKPRPRRGRAK